MSFKLKLMNQMNSYLNTFGIGIKSDKENSTSKPKSSNKSIEKPNLKSINAKKNEEIIKKGVMLMLEKPKIDNDAVNSSEKKTDENKNNNSLENNDKSRKSAPSRGLSCYEAKKTVDLLKKSIKEKTLKEPETQVQINPNNQNKGAKQNILFNKSNVIQVKDLQEKETIEDNKAKVNKEQKSSTSVNKINFKDGNYNNNRNAMLTNLNNLKFKKPAKTLENNDFLSRFELENFNTTSNFEGEVKSDIVIEEKDKTKKFSNHILKNLKGNYDNIQSKVKQIINGNNNSSNTDGQGVKDSSNRSNSKVNKKETSRTDILLKKTNELAEIMNIKKQKIAEDKMEKSFIEKTNLNSTSNLNKSNEKSELEKVALNNNSNNSNSNSNSKKITSGEKAKANDQEGSKKKTENDKKTFHQKKAKTNNRENYVRINLKKGYKERNRFKVKNGRKAKFDKFKKINKFNKELLIQEDPTYFGKGKSGLDDIETLIQNDDEAQVIYNLNLQNTCKMPYFSEGYLNSVIKAVKGNEITENSNLMEIDCESNDINNINSISAVPTPNKGKDNINERLLTQRLSTVLKSNINKKEAFNTIIRNQQKEFRSLIKHSNIQPQPINNNKSIDLHQTDYQYSTVINLNNKLMSFDRNNNDQTTNNNNIDNNSNLNNLINKKAPTKQINSFSIIDEKPEVNFPFSTAKKSLKSNKDFIKSSFKKRNMDPELEEDLLSENEISSLEDEILEKVVRDNFDFKSFLPGQLSIIKNLLNNKSTLAVLGNQSGKGLCYQAPSLVLDGITVLISPYVTLLYKHLIALPECLSGACLTSMTSSSQRHEILEALSLKKVKILFVTPERFCIEIFNNEIFKEVSLIVIDEATNASVNFNLNYYKSSYYSIIQILNNYYRSKNVPCLFFSSLTNKMRTDELKRIFNITEEVNSLTGENMLHPNKSNTNNTHNTNNTNLDLNVNANINESIIKSNINCFVLREEKENDKFNSLVKTLKHEITLKMKGKGSILVICNFKKRADEVKNYLNQNSLPCESYHSGKTEIDRQTILSNFLNNKYRIVVATSSFIYGLTKPDIRVIVMFDLPSSMEQYVTITSKAGLDGVESSVYSYIHDEDFFFQKSNLLSENLDSNKVFKLLDYTFSLVSRVGKIRAKRTLTEYEKQENKDPANYDRVLTNNENNAPVKLALCFSAVQDAVGVKKNVCLSIFDYLNSKAQEAQEEQDKLNKNDGELNNLSSTVEKQKELKSFSLSNTKTVSISSDNKDTIKKESLNNHSLESHENSDSSKNKRLDFIEVLGIAPSIIKLFIFKSKEEIFKQIKVLYDEEKNKNSNETKHVYKFWNSDAEEDLTIIKEKIIRYLEALFSICVGKDNSFSTVEALKVLGINHLELMGFLFYLQQNKLLSYNAVEEALLIKINYIPSNLTFAIETIENHVYSVINASITQLEILYLLLRKFAIKKSETVRNTTFSAETQIKCSTFNLLYCEYNNNFKNSIKEYLMKSNKLTEEEELELPTIKLDSQKDKSNLLKDINSLIDQEIKKISSNEVVLSNTWFGPCDLVNILMGIYSSKLNMFTSNKFWGVYKEYDYNAIFELVKSVLQIKKKHQH